jgi:DNA-binding response OmpR family regulator
MRVLVVDDEPRLAQNVAAGLREGPGYAVDVAEDGQAALQLLAVAVYDLVILDLMLPKLDGQTVLQRLRARDQITPVLVLTAVSGPKSAAQLLNDGADDYLTKPFDLGELTARARALVRRGKGVSATVLQVGELVLDTTHQTVVFSGQPADLSPTEYRIVEYLMHRPGVVVSKRELLEHLYDFTWEHHSNVIEAHISNLRRKLRTPLSLPAIETLRGRGYRLLHPRPGA